MGEDRLYEFVDANWKPSSVQEEDEEWYEPDIYEQMESCTEEKIGWMYIAPIMMILLFMRRWIMARWHGSSSTRLRLTSCCGRR